MRITSTINLEIRSRVAKSKNNGGFKQLSALWICTDSGPWPEGHPLSCVDHFMPPSCCYFCLLLLQIALPQSNNGTAKWDKQSLKRHHNANTKEPAWWYHQCQENSMYFCKIYQGGETELDARCLICLGDLAGGDKVKLLPECSHTFHPECIDMRLSSHSSCPLCRASLVSRRISSPVW